MVQDFRPRRHQNSRLHSMMGQTLEERLRQDIPQTLTPLATSLQNRRLLRKGPTTA